VQIGVNTLGAGAQLEDMIGLIEGMAGTRLVEREPSVAPKNS
jgi:3-hydroxyisobutyrate dehydrogenase